MHRIRRISNDFPEQISISPQLKNLITSSRSLISPSFSSHRQTGNTSSREPPTIKSLVHKNCYKDETVRGCSFRSAKYKKFFDRRKVPACLTCHEPKLLQFGIENSLVAIEIPTRLRFGRADVACI